MADRLGKFAELKQNINLKVACCKRRKPVGRLSVFNPLLL